MTQPSWSDETLHRLMEHMDHEEQLPEQLAGVAAQVSALAASIVALQEAFPGGDIHLHRTEHERMLAAAAAEEKFWSELRIDLAKKGLWAVLTVLIGLAVLGIGAKFGIGIK